MDDSTRRDHERNGRSKQFGIDNGQVFKNTPAQPLFDEIGTHFDNAAAKHADYLAAYGEAGMETTTKSTARENLRGFEARMAIAAQAMRDIHDGITEQFPMPRKIADADLLARGHAFHAASATYEADFIAYGNFDATFRDDLDAMCNTFAANTAAQMV